MELSCDICPKVCASKKSLKVHVDTHNKPYICKDCPKQFRFEKKFNEHIEKLHATFTCDMCSKVFSTSTKLTEHLKCHKQHEERYECKVCLQTIGKRSHLTRHENSHDMEKLYKCAGCPKTFLRADCLKRHECKKQKEAEPYHCNMCPYKDHKKYRLETHLKKHKKKEELIKRNPLYEHLLFSI